MLAPLLLAIPFSEDVPHPRRGQDPHAPIGYQFFGEGLANIGDLDADGFDEFTVSDPFGSDPPTVWILSGADARVIDRLSSIDCARAFGRAMAGMPDVDDDGIGEIAVGLPSWNGTAPGCVQICSGRTRAILRTIVAPLGIEGFGFDIAGLPDVDGDKRGDLLAMCAESSSERCAFVFSGATGRLLFEIWRPRWLVSPHATPIPDFDGDGHVDVALMGNDPRAHQSVFRVHSGRDGRVLQELKGSRLIPSLGVRATDFGSFDPSLNPRLLLSLITPDARPEMTITQVQLSTRIERVLCKAHEAAIGVIGDIDSDGEPDFVLTDPEAGLYSGSAMCRSGRTGKVLWEEPPWPRWRNTELRNMGGHLAVISDFDRDGIRDFIWGTDNSWCGSPSLVFISSGKTGRALKVLARGPDLEILRLGPME